MRWHEPGVLMCVGQWLADNLLESALEGFGFFSVQLDHEPPATFKWDPHHQASTLFCDFQRTVACPRLHRRHARTYPSH